MATVTLELDLAGDTPSSVELLTLTGDGVDVFAAAGLTHPAMFTPGAGDTWTLPYTATGAAKYAYTYRFTWPGGATDVAGGTHVAVPTITLPTYLQISEARQLAAQVPDVVAFTAAAADVQGMALVAATRHVDRARRWQGRKYDLTQALEFPRVAYQSSTSVVMGAGVGGLPIINLAAGQAGGGADVMWDWDYVNNVPIVPQNVKLATLYQADFVVSGKRAALQALLAGGVTSSKVGTLAETYDLALMQRLTAGSLCPDAAQLMEIYQLRQGRIL